MKYQTRQRGRFILTADSAQSDPAAINAGFEMGDGKEKN